MAVLFIIAKNWKQPRCPSTGDWLNTLIHSYHGMLLRDKEKPTIDTCNNLDDSQWNNVERETNYWHM